MTRRRLAWNAAWNWAGTIVGMAAGFVVAPHLIRNLGEDGYGLWILIASLTSYFSLFDLGVRGSVGRQIAFARARDDQEEVNATLNTSMAILSIVAVVALGATVLIQLAFFQIFDVPPGREAQTRLALMIVGANLALSFPLSVFDGTLWAYQRFDILNYIDIPISLLRVGLTLVLIDGGEGDLVTLALITVLTTILASSLKVLMSFRVEPRLRIGRSHLHRRTVGPLLNYSAWYFLMSIAQLVTSQALPLLIGARFSVAAVTPVSLASRLTGMANSFLVGASGILTPMATALHANRQEAKQQRLLIEGGRYCLSLSLYFVVLFLCVGEGLIRLWLGGGVEPAKVYTLLVVFSLGELLPLSQTISHSVILGIGSHKGIGYIRLAESGILILVGLLWGRALGLFGLCLAASLLRMLFPGLIQMIFACRVVGVPLRRYITSAILPALAAAVAPSSLLLALTWGRGSSHPWPRLIVDVGLYSACWAVVAVFMFGLHHKMRLLPRRPEREPIAVDKAIEST